MVIAGVYKDFKQTKNHLNEMALRQLFLHELKKATNETTKSIRKVQNGRMIDITRCS